MDHFGIFQRFCKNNLMISQSSPREKKIIYLTSFQGRFAALTASQVEDFGLQAILEKMNSLNTPRLSGPSWNISKIFQKLLIISPSSWPQKIQYKLTLVRQNKMRKKSEFFSYLFFYRVTHRKC